MKHWKIETRNSGILNKREIIKLEVEVWKKNWNFDKTSNVERLSEISSKSSKTRTFKSRNTFWTLKSRGRNLCENFPEIPCFPQISTPCNANNHPWRVSSIDPTPTSPLISSPVESSAIKEKYNIVSKEILLSAWFLAWSLQLYYPMFNSLW